MVLGNDVLSHIRLPASFPPRLQMLQPAGPLDWRIDAEEEKEARKHGKTVFIGMRNPDTVQALQNGSWFEQPEQWLLTTTNLVCMSSLSSLQGYGMGWDWGMMMGQVRVVVGQGWSDGPQKVCQLEQWLLRFTILPHTAIGGCAPCTYQASPHTDTCCGGPFLHLMASSLPSLTVC